MISFSLSLSFFSRILFIILCSRVLLRFFVFFLFKSFFCFFFIFITLSIISECLCDIREHSICILLTINICCMCVCLCVYVWKSDISFVEIYGERMTSTFCVTMRVATYYNAAPGFDHIFSVCLNAFDFSSLNSMVKSIN